MSKIAGHEKSAKVLKNELKLLEDEYNAAKTKYEDVAAQYARSASIARDAASKISDLKEEIALAENKENCHPAEVCDNCDGSTFIIVGVPVPREIYYYTLQCAECGNLRTIGVNPSGWQGKDEFG